MNDFGRDLGTNARAGADDAPCVHLYASLGDKASRLHDIGRQRARHFPEAIMKDNAMNILLSLFVGHCQGFQISENSVILANNEAPLAGSALIDRLVKAGLAIATGETPGRRTVGLTPLGAARMQSYLDDYPDV